MKQFKKRTIALVLASVITVAGSFAAENYKNSVMGINFVGNPNGQVNMILQTKTNYDGQISPIRKDSNTYVLMLPEFNSEAPTPDLTKANGCIESVTTKTMPYSTGGKGYTKVTVKTIGNVGLTATSQLYLPSAKDVSYVVNNVQKDNLYNDLQPEHNAEENIYGIDDKFHRNKYPSEKIKANKTEQPKTETYTQNIEENSSAVKNEPVELQKKEPEKVDISNNVTSDSSQKHMLILGTILIIAISVFLYLKAKDKLVDVVGEKLEIDIHDEDKQDKKSKEKKSVQKPRKVATTYKPITKPVSQKQPEQQLTPDEKLDIVDLDQLFQEQNVQVNPDEDENTDLDDFLREFSFEEESEPIEAEPLYDEEAYNKIINSSVKFTKDDIACINELLNSEIYEDTIQNAEKYAVSNPIAAKRPSKKEVLEQIVTELAISQNITFTKGDIDALRKLINVEIDPDFVTDLRTNPDRTKQMAKEIETKEIKPSKSKILTLNVKEMLPNLSEELSKQGKHIDSDGVKPMTVYYSEGYEYTKLKVDDMPDLSAELNNKDAYVSQPSYRGNIVETGYDFDKFTTVGSLPDLSDVMAHPEKYKEAPKEKAVVDENALLENILNVQFKPFDDGSREFEVLNDFDDETAPSVDDIQKEFSQFGNLEIAEDTQENVSPTNADYDDFEAIYNNEYVDLDKSSDDTKEEVKEPPKIVREVVEPRKQHFDRPVAKRAPSQKTEELMQKIAAARSERISLRNEILASKTANVRSAGEKLSTTSVVKCIYEGINYDILDSVTLNRNLGCHLAKNENGYVIFAFEGNNLSKLKEYPSVRTEKIQARLSGKIANGNPRYIVRVGANKFIVDIEGNHICYVMDLC